ncbi:MAG TPA: Uma2 family endonuclease [Acidimicrobiales bacterium]|nr:Uma2 family endonuclease [Acidimicrobiales bacterium]HWI02232.1 Uma2 family endonuclease [Acidimicrobiales bacterium]
MALTSTRLTAEEYFALPPTEYRTQLIDGEVVVTEASLRHQRITLELAHQLTVWLRQNSGHGEAGIPVNVHLDDYNVYAPDVWWVPEDARPGRDAKRIVGPPALAVEVRSPSTWRYDIGTKRATYERLGLKELWLVDTGADTVLVYRRSSPEAATFDVALELEAGTVLTTPLIPGFALDLGGLFAL